MVGLDRVIESWASATDVADGRQCSYLSCTLAIVATILAGCFLDLIAPNVVKFVGLSLVDVTKIAE